ncbi:MAG: sulfatase family protein [Opitutaceae bacterium]
MFTISPRLTTLISLLLLCTSCFATLQKPNIVVVLADDLGLGDIGRQHLERTGSAPLAPTPTLDALADAGMWFTDAHSSAALCAPARYSLMTGNYNFRSYSPGGVWGAYSPNAISSSDTTIGSLVQSVGYTTGFVGKWHLGGDFYATGTTNVSRRNDENTTPDQVDMSIWIDGGPQNIGFDYDFTVATGVQGPTYVAHENGVWYPWAPDSQLIFYDDTTAIDPLFVSDKGHGIGDSNWNSRDLNMLLADKAASFISDSATTGEPFMLYYCSPAVHIPHTPPTSIDGDPISGTTPTAHLDMNRVLDLEVKKIVDALKAAGVYDNTLIIFTSDNGGLTDGTAQSAGHLSNGGFRGNKNQAFEGGHRVPFIAVWPYVIPANSTSDAMINGTDILATLADVSGASFTDDHAKDSHSIFPILLGNVDYEPRTEMMQQGGTAADLMLRDGPWKLIIGSSQGHNNLTKADTSPSHLYNLDDNPTENDSSNLINNAAYASRISSMYERYWEMRQSSTRTAPPHGFKPSSLSDFIDEDFTQIADGDTTATNQPITDGNHDTELRLNNNANGMVTTNPSFGDGNVFQISTGTNATGGWGALSSQDNPVPVSFEVGDEVTLSFDMLIQAVPATSEGINIQLRMSDATDISRVFTEYTSATVGDIISFSWTVVVDADMANATDLYIWIPIEGFPTNYATGGPNDDGTELNVMQLDNIKLSAGSESTGYHKFADGNLLVEGPSGDDDGDGILNVFEYIYGTDPQLSDSSSAAYTEIVEHESDEFSTVRYSRSKSAAENSALRIWRATDLAENDWQLGGTEVVSVTPDATDPDLEHVVERSLYPISESEKEFFLLDAIIAP